MTITLYDMANAANIPVSVNTWKARYCLNFKGLPYRTEWVERPDIEPRFIELGIAPTGKKPDGSAFYTVLAIYDSATGQYVTDSWNIAIYLDKTYPDTPTLIAKDTTALQLAFTDAYSNTGSLNAALLPFIIPKLNARLTPRGAADFVQSIEAAFGQKIHDITPKGGAATSEWAKYKANLGIVDSWYAVSSSMFLLGDAPSWADFLVAAYFAWARVALGEESEQWKDITSWHEGRWKHFMDSLREYEIVL